MRPGRRFGLSAAQKLEVWSRWKAGQTLHQIGRVWQGAFLYSLHLRKSRVPWDLEKFWIGHANKDVTEDNQK